MKLENGLLSCNCPKKKCVRHGRCAECIEHHKSSRRPPYCKKEKSGRSSKMRMKKGRTSGPADL